MRCIPSVTPRDTPITPCANGYKHRRNIFKTLLLPSICIAAWSLKKIRVCLAAGNNVARAALKLLNGSADNSTSGLFFRKNSTNFGKANIVFLAFSNTNGSCNAPNSKNFCPFSSIIGN